jgi:hypothetical protein
MQIHFSGRASKGDLNNVPSIWLDGARPPSMSIIMSLTDSYSVLNVGILARDKH